MGIDISVVIPTYKRIEGLEKCLKSFFTQDYPKEGYEIIVVDDGNDEAVRIMVDQLQEKHPNLRYLAQGHRGPAVARNLGAQVSLGRIIAFIDDDCGVCDGWLRAVAEGHRKNPEIMAIGGLTLSLTQKSPVLVSQFLSNCSIETQVNDRKEVIFFPTCNVSLKRQMFDKYKFNETFPLPGGEDLEFFWRLFQEGYRFIWDKEITVIHNRDDTTLGFLRQAYIYGRGNLLAQHLHNDQPLLKELKTGKISFWAATLINTLKIPRFSCLLGARLIRQNSIKDIHKKSSVYAYFFIHKIFYLLGNIAEFIRIRRENLNGRYFSRHIPRLLILDITHACNLKCQICDIWKTAAVEPDIDITYIKKLLLQAKELNIKEVALSGGESLLRKDIFDVFTYARDLKIKNLGVLTNGILVKKYMQKLLPYLKDNTVSLVISLDSLRQDLHNQIRNSSFAWQRTMESLHMLSFLKKKVPRINFNVITIILNENLEELADLSCFIKSLGAKSLQFQALLPNNLNMPERKHSSFWVPPERYDVLDKTIEALITFKEANPAFIKNSSRNLALIKKYYRKTLTTTDVECSSADKTVLISNLGKCTTCFTPYGDIRKSNFREILSGEARLRAQSELVRCTWPCLLPCFCD